MPLRTMYDLLRAASNLRAYLPLVQYILTTTIENIAEADKYLMDLETLLSTGVSTETGKYAEDIQRIANETITRLVNGFADENINTETAFNEVLFSLNIGTAQKYPDLIVAVINLRILFTNSTLMQQTNAMVAAFTNISTSLTSAL